MRRETWEVFYRLWNGKAWEALQSEMLREFYLYCIEWGLFYNCSIKESCNESG